MSNILRAIPVFIVFAFFFACYFLAFGAFFSSRVEKTSEYIRQSHWRSFWIGLVNFLFFGAIVLLLFALSDGMRRSALGFVLLLPGLVITAILFILMSLGLTAMSAVLGERLFPQASAWKRNFFAAIILSIGCSLPIVGWLLLFPYAAWTGLGAVLLTYLQRNK